MERRLGLFLFGRVVPWAARACDDGRVRARTDVGSQYDRESRQPTKYNGHVLDRATSTLCGQLSDWTGRCACAIRVVAAGDLYAYFLVVLRTDYVRGGVVSAATIRQDFRPLGGYDAGICAAISRMAEAIAFLFMAQCIAARIQRTHDRDTVPRRAEVF